MINSFSSVSVSHSQLWVSQARNVEAFNYFMQIANAATLLLAPHTVHIIWNDSLLYRVYMPCVRVEYGRHIIYNSVSSSNLLKQMYIKLCIWTVQMLMACMNQYFWFDSRQNYPMKSVFTIFPLTFPSMYSLFITWFMPIQIRENHICLIIWNEFPRALLGHY